MPGTQVTITGSGFGAQQGTGQVWLGTANGVVQSWSDSQVVALVAAGAASGNAQILQGGVMSNAVPFTVNTPHLASISPTSGPPGTSVTFTGSGFGSLQGTGAVALGSAAGQVVSWSDTTVVATVASTALTGIAKIQQNGVWSNALGFTVPAPGGNTLMPSLLNMVVGDQRTLQALGPAGLVTGLAWTSSDPAIVNLSTDDPPALTALAAGHVTITAGGASADVTVWDPSLLPGGALHQGTVLWSNPGDGSGVQSIVPAVPSTSGVADVFAFQNDGTVQAITSDGTVAWTATVGWRAIPDFQGGLVTVGQDGSSIYKLDGITGQPYPAYTLDPFPAVTGLAGVHTDGTIFAIQSTPNGGGTYTTSVIGIDPLAGTQKFSVPLPAGDTGAGNEEVLDFMIAGDGYAYVACQFRESTGVGGPAGALNHLSVVQVSSAGASANIDVFDWTSPYTDNIGLWVGMITNADQGILITWRASSGQMTNPMMAITTGTSVSMVSAPQVPGGGQVLPVLQAQDGSFVGTTEDPDTYNNDMVAFDATGATRWIVPNETPQIATADGGVIGQSGITYDQYGNATGQMASLPIQSWTGNLYQDGSVDQLAGIPVSLAASLWSYLAFEVDPAAAQALPDLVKATYDVVGPDPLGNGASLRDITYQALSRNSASCRIKERGNCGKTHILIWPATAAVPKSTGCRILRSGWHKRAGGLRLNPAVHPHATQTPKLSGPNRAVHRPG